MSCLTENTILIKTKDADKFINIISENENYKNTMRFFHNEEYSLYAFDCNGQPMEIEDSIDFLVLETNYLDGEPLYTQIYDNNTNSIRDSRNRASYWIKKYVGEERFERLKQYLKYSDGRV